MLRKSASRWSCGGRRNGSASKSLPPVYSPREASGCVVARYRGDTTDEVVTEELQLLQQEQIADSGVYFATYAASAYAQSASDVMV